MRFFSYQSNNAVRIGVTQKDANTFIDLHTAAAHLPTDMTALLADANAFASAKAVAASAFSTAADSSTHTATRQLTGITYAPMVPHPPKIVCVGLNYADHAKEGGNARPEYPSFFLRGTTSLVAHGQPIIRPRVSQKLDYEAELVIVIGKRAKHLTRANALDCVAGYTCFNDGSLRDYQRKTTQWTIGKNFDATGGLGPWMVTADELPAGAAGLRIQSRLNGKVMQDANTHDFLWDVVETLVILSECMTLEPGDVIATGTPAGVGYARTPPVFMQPGDVCEIEIEGIGVLSNTIADEAAG
jgi:2-keto-4-pentenoate hydratase/2-oxohepta-3-ene-1,7-dioic acid hydratase in catechol pathway